MEDKEKVYLDSEIVDDDDYLDAEILDDDDDAPVGTLVSADKAPQNAPADDNADSASTDSANVADVPKINFNLGKQRTLSDELSTTKFEIERPVQAPAKVEKPAPAKKPAVKKQPSIDDLWAVAPVAQRKAPVIKKEEPAPAKAEKPAAKKESKPAVKKAEPVKNEPAAKQDNAPAKKVAKTKAAAPAPAKEETPAPQKTTKAKVKNDAPASTTPSTTPVENTKPNKSTEDKKKVADVKEIEWIVEPTEKYAGSYIIKKTDKGNFVFKLFAYNKNCLAIGAQPYTSVAGCKAGINSIINNAGIGDDKIFDLRYIDPKEKLPCPRWEIYQDKKGEFRLRLYASNGNLVATTNDGYMQVSGAKKGIESIAKASIGAGIRRDDNLW